MRSATMMLAAMCNATAMLAQASVSPRLRSTRAGAARVGRRASRLRVPRAVPTSVDASETTEAESPEPLLIVVECDGVLCDVHLDGHREVRSIIAPVPVRPRRRGARRSLRTCLLYTSPSPRDLSTSRMPSSA